MVVNDPSRGRPSEIINVIRKSAILNSAADSIMPFG